MRALKITAAVLALAWAGAANAQTVRLDFSFQSSSFSGVGTFAPIMEDAYTSSAGYNGYIIVDDSPLAEGQSDLAITSGSITVGDVTADLTGQTLRVYHSSLSTSIHPYWDVEGDYIPQLDTLDHIQVIMGYGVAGSLSSLSQLRQFAPNFGFSTVNTRLVPTGTSTSAPNSLFSIYSNVIPSFSISSGASGGLGAGALPEPSTWAMMILGIGAAGYGLRKRRVSYSPAAV